MNLLLNLVLLMKCLVTEIFDDVDMYAMMPFHTQAGSAPLEAQRQIPFSPEAQCKWKQDSNQACPGSREAEWICLKNKVAEGPGYIGGNQQSSLTWEHQLVLSSRRNKQRGISLTKNIWSSSCFILRSVHGISCSQTNLHLFSHRYHWRKSMWWLPNEYR